MCATYNSSTIIIVSYGLIKLMKKRPHIKLIQIGMGTNIYIIQQNLYKHTHVKHGEEVFLMANSTSISSDVCKERRQYERIGLDHSI